MKKLFLALGLVFAVSVSAAEYQVIPLLTVNAINVTNTVGVTNLNSWVAWSTNAPTMYYTNRSGIRASTASASYVNLVGEAELWGQAHGVPYTNTVDLGATYVTDYSLIIVVGPHGGTASTVNCVFKPLFGDDQTGGGTTYAFAVAVAAAAAGDTVSATPVPVYKWPGVRKIRLEAVYVTAGASKSNVVKEVSLVGWR